MEEKREFSKFDICAVHIGTVLFVLQCCFVQESWESVSTVSGHFAPVQVG